MFQKIKKMTCPQIRARINKETCIYLFKATPQRRGHDCARLLQKAVCLNAWNAHLPFGFTYLLLHK